MTSTCLEKLLKRTSVDTFKDPVPSGKVLEDILSAGLRAPDHGRIRPWRWVLIQGEERQSFGKLIKEANLRMQPDISEGKLLRRVARFEKAPLVIALGGMLEEGRIPLDEQRCAVAAGVMNILNALYLEGFGGIWISGQFCNDPSLKISLGLKQEGKIGELFGFIFAGTPESTEETIQKKRPHLSDHMTVWKNDLIGDHDE